MSGHCATCGHAICICDELATKFTHDNKCECYDCLHRRLAAAEARYEQLCRATSCYNCTDMREQLAAAEARVDTLTGHLNWFGWNSDGVANVRAEIERLDKQLAAAKANYAKLHGCVETYIKAPGQIRGEAYRDLVGAFEALAGCDTNLGWPACYARLEKQLAAAEAATASEKSESQLLRNSLSDALEQLAAAEAQLERGKAHAQERVGLVADLAEAEKQRDAAEARCSHVEQRVADIVAERITAVAERDEARAAARWLLKHGSDQLKARYKARHEWPWIADAEPAGPSEVDEMRKLLREACDKGWCGDYGQVILDKRWYERAKACVEDAKDEQIS